jgi:cytochrome d ubiquinol oxidase subunit I
MEGIWETERGAPLLLFAVPDEELRDNHFEIGIPKLASLILTHELDGELKGLNEFEGEHPRVAPVFYGFRIMVGIGILMLLVSWVALWQLIRKNHLSATVKMALVGMTFSGWVATLAGWYVTEIGRQPWLVQGLLKTADAVSPIPAANLTITLAVYLTLYAALIVAYVSTVFHLARKPTSGNPTPAGLPEGTATS